MNCCDDYGKCTCTTGTDPGANPGASPAQPATGCTHDCLEGRACTCAPKKAAALAPAPGRSCDALALCQRRVPRCQGCIEGLALTSEGIRFAPGEIEAYRAPRRSLERAVLWLAGAAGALAGLLMWLSACGLAGIGAGALTAWWTS